MFNKLFFWTGVPLLHAEGHLASVGPTEGHDPKATVYRFIKEVQWNTKYCDWSFLLETSGVPFEHFGWRKYTFYNPGKQWLVQGDPVWVRRNPKTRAPSLNAASYRSWMKRGVDLTPAQGVYTSPNVTALRGGVLGKTQIHHSLSRDGTIERGASSCMTQAHADHIAQRLGQRANWPLFSVVESNSFHNGAFILSTFAFDKALEPRPHKLIINFDAHPDTGGTDNYVASDTWGGCMRREGRTDAFLVIGILEQFLTLLRPGVSLQRGDGRFGGVILKSGNHVGNAATNSNWCLNPADVSTLIDYVVTRIGAGRDGFRLSTCDVYVSIDRDFMRTNFSIWGDKGAKFKSTEAYNVVNNVLAKVFEDNGGRARLVGFDVTGLPVNAGGWRDSTYGDDWVRGGLVARMGGVVDAVYDLAQVDRLRKELKAWYDLANSLPHA